MKVEEFVKALDADFYTGVPDSQLKALCNYLIFTYGIDARHHVIAANEGNCTALAAGYYLATGKIPVVYMQNSGEGNIINPVASLLNDNVYGIPTIFVVGWRGEPNVHDEPQHVYQGMVTLKLLEDMDISTFVVDDTTSLEELSEVMKQYRKILSQGKQVAFVIRKGALNFEQKVEYKNKNSMCREEIISHIVEVADNDVIVCTTGKASRELFEIREARGQEHKFDFLTVGSMGHASSIALGVAIQKPNSRVWCVDGDGAALMHMGAMAVLADYKPNNFIHIVINNGAHETVGGMPTVCADKDLALVAKALGYPRIFQARNKEELDQALLEAKNSNELSFLEIKCSIGARVDLGRPTTTAKQNKEDFMNYLKTIN